MTDKPAPNEFAAEIGSRPVAITSGVMEQFKPSEIGRAVKRHMTMDWSDMDEEDAAMNRRAAMEGGSRVFSAFRVRAKPDERCDLWIITEADRSHTTILLPEEY
jgi:hypothetical protein